MDELTLPAAARAAPPAASSPGRLGSEFSVQGAAFVLFGSRVPEPRTGTNLEPWTL